MIYSDQLDILRAERAEIAHCFLISHEEIAELTKENTELKRLMAAQASGWCYVLLLTTYAPGRWRLRERPFIIEFPAS